MPAPLAARLHLERALAHHRALLERQAPLARRADAGRAQASFAAALRDHLVASSTLPPTEGAREEVQEVVVRPGDTLWSLAVHRFHVHVGDLARQNELSESEPLRPGQVLRVRRTIDPTPRRVVASWYGPGFDGRPMANGDPYDRHAPTIAHRTLPLGTEVELRNPRTGVVARARVEDRGPYVSGREVDLSWHLARELGILEPGVGELEMRVLG